jgi:protein ImuB
MPGLPIVLLVTTVANRELVARCCAQARAHGVSPGMPLAEARTLCPGGVGRLRVSAFEPDRSRQALDVLAKWALRFSPAVMVDPTSSNPYPIDSPDGLLLDVTGEAHLFGGEHPLVAEIASRVAWLRFSTRLAIAPTTGAAWAIARFGLRPMSMLAEDGLQNALAPLPVAALRLPAHTLDTLGEVGIEHIGHLFHLPREHLLARYGEDLLLRLDQAIGGLPEHLEPLHPTEPLTVRRVFERACVQLDALFLATQGLLEELSHHLLEKESGARSLRIEWTRINAPPVSRELFLNEPTRDPGHLWSLLLPKVESLAPGYGVEAITLTASWTDRIRHRQLGAWDTGDPPPHADTHDQEYAAILDTLINRSRKPGGNWQGGRMTPPKPFMSHPPQVTLTFEAFKDHCD